MKNNIYQFFTANGLILIIVIAFAIRMLFFVSLGPWNNEVVENTVITTDAIEYNELALSLVNTKSFEDFDGYRTPGYPIFIALLYSISSNSPWFVLLIQVFLSLISVLLVFKIAAIIFSKKIALLSAFLFAIDLNQALYAVRLHSESVFVFLFLMSVYYLCKSIRRNSISSICLSALVLGLAALERPIAFLLPLILIFFILVFCNLKLKVKLMYSILIGVIFISTLSPWLLHNYTKHGVAKLTTQTGSNLLFYNVAYTEAHETGKPLDQVRNDFNALAIKQGIDTTRRDSFQNSPIYFSIAQQYIKENFILYCKTHFIGITNMYSSLGIRNIASIFYEDLTPVNSNQWENPNLFNRIFDFFHKRANGEIIISLGLSFFMLINYLFTLFAIFLLLRRNEKFLFLFILIILYFSVLTGVIGNARLRIPIMPFINILCAVGILFFYDKRFSKLFKTGNLI